MLLSDLRVDQLAEYADELHKREWELADYLAKWKPRGGSESFTLYRRYVDSGCVTLPYAGGWLDQPAWWTDDVTNIELMIELEWIPTQIKNVQKELEHRVTKGNGI